MKRRHDRSGPVAHAELRETHSAYVVLIGDVAYKAKKPVRTAFLDFTTITSRRRALECEHVLNARFAPDVYAGVGELTDPTGGPAEPVLRMRRLPDAERLSTLAHDRTRDVTDDLDDVARRVASVHATSRRSAAIDHEGTRDSLAERWCANLSETRSDDSGLLDDSMLDEIDARVRIFLGGRSALFERRIEERRIVDGHGDLLGDDIFCMADGPRILDCLDFDDALRFVDGIDDAACLAMDLEFHDRPDLAEHFVAAYREAASDLAPPSLVHHYIAYRAFVRAKVACIRYLQGNHESRCDAQDHSRLALEHLRQATVALTIVGGLPGSGKTTLADYVAVHTESVVVSSDVTRKNLGGFSPSSSHKTGIRQDLYEPEMTRRTYDAMLSTAHALLSSGSSVILDASWTDLTLRERAEGLAVTTSSSLVQIECIVPEAVALQRIASRTGSASDATSDVYHDMAGRQQAWPSSTKIDTGADPTTSGDAAVTHWRRCIAESASTIPDRTGAIG